MVIVDKFTKYGHFVGLSHPYTATTVAQSLLDTVIKLHGPPTSIISDRDTIFMSHFWKELLKVMGIQSKLSTAYHPQTDGQTERVNQCLEMYLRCMVGNTPAMWSHWLPLVELWYNTCHHSTVGMSPCKALYNQDPPSLNYQQARATNPTVKKFIQDRTQTLQLLRENFLKAQERMTWYANKKRT